VKFPSFRLRLSCLLLVLSAIVFLRFLYTDVGKRLMDKVFVGPPYVLAHEGILYLTERGFRKGLSTVAVEDFMSRPYPTDLLPKLFISLKPGTSLAVLNGVAGGAEVRVMSGPHKGASGWISGRTFRDEDRK
jgi:hypothetical protein